MDGRLLKEITQIKKQISLLEDYVRVGETSFSFITTDNDDTKTDKINRALLQDINTAAKNAGVKAVITTAVSGHSDKTISGRRSRHPDSNAVDISIISGEKAQGASSNNSGNPKFKELGDKLVDELVKLGYVWNPNDESANQKAIFWQTDTGGNHYNHIHVSNITDAASEESETDSTDSTDAGVKDGQFQQEKPSFDISQALKSFEKFKDIFK
jgi:hypothetical protein